MTPGVTCCCAALIFYFFCDCMAAMLHRSEERPQLVAAKRLRDGGGVGGVGKEGVSRGWGWGERWAAGCRPMKMRAGRRCHVREGTSGTWQLRAQEACVPLARDSHLTFSPCPSDTHTHTNARIHAHARAHARAHTHTQTNTHRYN